MKKYLPLILIAVGILVLVVAIVMVSKRSKNEAPSESGIIEVSLNDRPVASLVPTSDGHWLKLLVTKLKIAKAESMDYELLYQLPDGRTQGVPGTIALTGQSEIERDLLLGSESNGKFRYDEGVTEGSLTLRFRDAKGKLLTKFTTKFHLLTGVKELTSIDTKLTFTLDKTPSKGFFVVMETFGVPMDVSYDVVAGPYGVFSSGELFSGDAKLTGAKIYASSGGSFSETSSVSSVARAVFVSSN